MAEAIFIHLRRVPQSLRSIQVIPEQNPAPRRRSEYQPHQLSTRLSLYAKTSSLRSQSAYAQPAMID